MIASFPQFYSSFVKEAGLLIGSFFEISGMLLRGRLDKRQLLVQLNIVGLRSIPVVLLTALFTGAIMVVQSLAYVRSTGATSFIPGLSAKAVFSELGPALIALMFSGRVGANTAASLALMRSTDQIDALEALGLSTLRYFVVPRFAAMVLMMVFLCAAGNVFSLLGSALLAQLLLDLDAGFFFGALRELSLGKELTVGLIKAAVFGAVVALLSCHQGLSSGHGAGAVGEAVNKTVVKSALTIYFFDFLITWIWYRSLN